MFLHIGLPRVSLRRPAVDTGTVDIRVAWPFRKNDTHHLRRISTLYSWHATQEHRWFSQGSTFSVVSFGLLPMIGPILLNKTSNPGARSSIYVLLDAF